MTPNRRCPAPWLAALLGLLLTGSILTAPPATSAGVDDYADYEPQTACASSTKPGTAFLIRWLTRSYRGTGSASTLRACTSGTSEHKDGRALDWAVDAVDPVQRAQAYDFLERLFAADTRGNRHALARRMGIMYLIWNDRIYSAYGSPGFAARDYSTRACGGKLRTCSKTTRHRDHVHISLSRSGAAAQTTFYRARRVASDVVLIPGTRQLDPEATAVAKIEVPGDGTAVRSTFKVTRGRTYRIVGDGLHRYAGNAGIEDAACRWSTRADTWVRSENTLLVNGSSPWRDTCDGRHTHVRTYKARRTGYLWLRVADEQPRGNSGSLNFYVLRSDVPLREATTRFTVSGGGPRPARVAGPSAPRLARETVDVPARARRGVLSTRSLRPGATYRVRVTGVARSDRTTFDANCARYAGWMRQQHTLDLTKPEADHLALFIQGVRVELRVPGSEAGCDGRTHEYVGSFRAVVAGRANVRIWDPYSYADNTGELSVALKRA